jgi:pSer/pThr/pTyr-binding forkhead associated (FHA) protein
MMAEKFCPNCQKKNDTSAAFCKYCGVPLEFSQDNPTTTSRIEPDSSAQPSPAENVVIGSLELPDEGVAVYLKDYAKPIAVRTNQEFIIGRKLTPIDMEAFVDLVPFGAYENGVSQRHAMIRQASHGWEIIDLGSTNGTWLDNKRLLPNKPYSLHGFAQIHLGRMCLYIYIPRAKTGNNT